jgi:hypothetical protein
LDPVFEARHVGAGSLLALHFFVGALMLGGALHLHTQTLERIRAVHPGYPKRMVLTSYTPGRIAQRFHAAGPLALNAVTLGALLVSVASVARKRGPSALNVLVIGANFVVLLAAIYAYAMSAVQLAGIAALLMRGGS